VVQLGRGIFLAIHYSPDTGLAFESVSHIIREVQGGWLLRIVHANGASAFFFFLYIHVARGVYYRSFRFVLV
jgi:ubiquinol-cytochrome c reductase cytochrome b subunit